MQARRRGDPPAPATEMQVGAKGDMDHQMIIARRFCGPSDSGNGGYVCGMVDGLLSGETEVTLRRPPPLETPLGVEIIDSQRIRLVDGSGVVAEGRCDNVEFTVPFRPSLEQARLAAERYAGFKQHDYPNCFVCGPARTPGDGLRIFAGPLPEGEGVAAPWVPDPSLADTDGRVRSEFVWAALDCPGYFAVDANCRRHMLLGRMAASVERRPRAAEQCVVAAWRVGSEGRKHFASSVLLSESGHVMARARATWIEIKAPA